MIRILIICLGFFYSSVYSQKNSFERLWSKSSRIVDISYIKPEQFMSAKLDSSDRISITYTKKGKCFYGVLQNYVNIGASSYIIQDADFLVVLKTSPFLFFPGNPREVWEDIYYCNVIDLKNKRHVSFQLEKHDSIPSFILGGKKIDFQCYAVQTRELINISKASVGKELNDQIFCRFKELLNNYFIKNLNFESISCNQGVWYTYTELNIW